VTLGVASGPQLADKSARKQPQIGAFDWTAAGVFGFISVGRFFMAVMLHTVLIMICFCSWSIDFAG
jgi:hypothetical protein